jgi:tetratricopeptide (TPR) repeat protein
MRQMIKPEILELEKQAEVLRGQHKFAEAVEKIKQALDLDETFVRGHLTLAVLYHYLNEPEQSCRHGERACELEPNDPFNFTALSVTYQRAFEGTRNPEFIHKAEMAMARSRA